MALISDLLFLSAAILTTINAQDPVPDIRLPPSISVGPDKIYFYQNLATSKPFNITCEAIGSPEPTYRWTKDGTALNMNGIVYPDPTLGTIEIVQPSKDHEGYYQCFATNIYGRTMSNVALLRVGSLDQYDAKAPTVRIPVVPNDKLRVNCNAPESIPSAIYSWSYNTTTTFGQTDLVLSRRVQIDFDGNLCFASISSSETSNRLFRCNVNNRAINTIAYGSYSWIDVSGPAVNNIAPALFFSSPSTVIAFQSEQTTLRCFFSGTDQNGQGLIQYSWTYNGRNAMPQGWIIRDGDLSSPATGTDPSAAGIYVCTGRNTIGEASATIELIVEAIPDFGSSDNENQPRDMNVTEGDTITINCRPDAIPNATIQWFKNTQAFDTNNLPPKFELSNYLMTLTISDICKDCEDGSTDLMNIQCNTTNTHGYGFAQGYVNVLLASTITSGSVSVQWEPLKNYQLDCASTCDDSTPCTTDWTFEGQPLDDTDDRVFVDDVGSLFVMTENDTDDGSSRIGTYTCTVSNDYSEAAINATIKEGVPGDASLWWVGLLVALLVILLLLLLLLCCFCCFCVDGKSYPVDKRERENGNNPVEDLRKLAINEYVPNQLSPNVYLPVYITPAEEPQPPANGSFTVGSQAVNPAYEEDPTQVHLPIYTVEPSHVQLAAPPNGLYYVHGNGYQIRSLSHESQGEVFNADDPDVFGPYGAVPQSEV